MFKAVAVILVILGVVVAVFGIKSKAFDNFVTTGLAYFIVGAIGFGVVALIWRMFGGS